MISCHETFSIEPEKRLSSVCNEDDGLQTGSLFGPTLPLPYEFNLKHEFKVDCARAFDLDASSEIMLLSRAVHGVDGDISLSKINFSRPSESETIPLPPRHTIQDLCLSKRSDKLALLALSEKKLSVVSCLSNTFVHSFYLPASAWSCAWDANDAHYVYAGLENGMLAIFDLRQTASPTRLFTGIYSKPIHTLHSVQHTTDNGGLRSARTLISASTSGICEWNVGDAHDKSGFCKDIDLNLENQGVCMSLACGASANDIVATYRKNIETPADIDDSQPAVLPASSPGSATLGSHVYIKREDSGKTYNVHKLKPSYVSVVQTPKSAVISMDEKSSLFAYGDVGTCGVLFRELPSLRWGSYMAAPHDEYPVLGVRYASTASSRLLGLISGNKAQVFSIVSRKRR